MIVVQTENPKFGPSFEKTAETINLWDDCRGWQDDGGGGAVPGRQRWATGGPAASPFSRCFTLSEQPPTVARCPSKCPNIKNEEN